jgi:peptidyl-prolyl isomerase D
LYLLIQSKFIVPTAKALYRRAVAQAMLKEDDDAERDLVEATQLAPDDRVIAAELVKVQKQKKARREKEKKAYRRLFE